MPLVAVAVGVNVGLEVKVTVGVKVGVQEAQGVFVKVAVGAGGLDGYEGLELLLQAIDIKDKAARSKSATTEVFIENPFTSKRIYPAKFGRGFKRLGL